MIVRSPNLVDLFNDKISWFYVELNNSPLEIMICMIIETGFYKELGQTLHVSTFSLEITNPRQSDTWHLMVPSYIHGNHTYLDFR